MPEKKLVTFLAQVEDIDRWKVSAHEARMNLSKWIRTALEVASASPVRAVQAVAAATELSEQRKGSLSEMADSLLQKATDKRDSGKCINRLPKGAFCKRCGQIHV